MTISSDTALVRLRNAIRALPPAREMVQVGGHVYEAAPGRFRVRGLGRDAALGDFVIDGRDAAQSGEIVALDAEGALVQPHRADNPLHLGASVYRTGPFAIAPCENWRGRTIDALANPIDGRGPLPRGVASRPVDQTPPDALRRGRIATPFTTGVRAVDAFTPLCVGQRIGLFAGSGVGKSTLLGMLSAATGFDDIVVGLIGERGREVREFLEGPLAAQRDNAIVVVSTGDETALLRRLAARTATAIAEYFRDRGRRVLLVIDSITRFAQASREVAIAAGEPAVARGFPPSVFSDLPRLLERAGPGAANGGSITALYAVLIDGDDHNDPVADTVRGALDGHIVLDRAIADQGRFPAIDLLGSISRLADLCWSVEQRALVRRLKSMVARFEETRDIRAMGGLQAGADPDLDAALVIVPKLYDRLTQARDDRPSVAAFEELAAALRIDAPTTGAAA